MLRTASSIVNPAAANQRRERGFRYNPSSPESNRTRALYLNSIVFGCAAVKPLVHCFSPKLSQSTWTRVSSRTL
jgi:hypothetical protein